MNQILCQHNKHFCREFSTRMKYLAQVTIGLICISLFLYQATTFFIQFLENPTARRIAFKELRNLIKPFLTIVNIASYQGRPCRSISHFDHRTSEKLTSRGSHCASLTEDTRRKVCRGLTMLELKISSVGIPWEMTVTAGYN